VDIKTRIDGEVMHIELEGRLDAAWSGTVGKALQDSLHAGCHAIALDLSRVTFLSSAGIRVILLLAKQLAGIGGRLRLLDPTPPVRDVLDLVGFGAFLEQGGEAGPAAIPPAPSESPIDAEPPAVAHHRFGEHRFEVYAIRPGGSMRLSLVGDPAILDGRTADPAGTVRLRLSPGTLAIGLGALGGDSECRHRMGELLAAENVAIALPGDDPAHPDWLLREGAFVPEISVLYALRAEGEFPYLARFGTMPDTPAISLSQLAEAVLSLCGCDVAAFAAVAETAALVGAAMQAPPEPVPSDFFAFPGIRDRLLFTAEPAFTDETCLLVGVAAKGAPGALQPWLRPMGPACEVAAHVHAAAVPYRPIGKGLLGLEDALAAVLENQRVRGVLHLLNDAREGVGAGESFLRRGAVWCAPAALAEEEMPA
jgi:anti-anti-sigma factor